MCNADACDALITPICGKFPKVGPDLLPLRDANGNYILGDVRVKCGDSTIAENNVYCLNINEA
jgi:hypothetical protein